MDRRSIQASDLYEMKFITDPRLSPDGAWIAFALSWIDASRDTYRTGVWAVPVEGQSSSPSTLSSHVGLMLPIDSQQQAIPLTNVNPAAQPFHDRSPRWNPATGDLAFLSNRSGKNQVWLLPMRGGEARPLIRFDGAVSEFCWSADGRRVAFVARKPAADESEKRSFRVITTLRYKANGSGYTDPRPRQVWVADVATGEITRISDGDHDDTSPTFSPDGRRLAFISDRHSDPRGDVDPHATEELRSSPRSRSAELTQDVWVVNLETGQLEVMSRGTGPCSMPTWSPQGDKIAYFANPDNISASNMRLYVAPLCDGEPICVTKDFDRSMGNSLSTDMKYRQAESGPRWAPDGSAVYFVATDRGHAVLFSTSPYGGPVKREVDIEGFSVTSFDVTRTPVGGTAGTFDAPSTVAKQGHAVPFLAYCGGTQLNPCDVYVGPYNDHGGARGHRRLTSVNGPLLSSLTLSPHERVTYVGDKGWIIEAWLMKPTGFQEGNRYPVVIQIHGGPASTVGEVFNHEFQLMAARGYGVFYMNFRGSKGYGQEFSRAIVGDRGGGEFRDIIAGVDMLEQLSWVDRDRMYLTGGSFGGYETNWIVSQTSRFRAAVAQRSCSNVYSKIGTADNGFYHNVAYMAADLWDGEDFLMSRSPIRYAPNVRTPLLIVHSDQDLRLPLEQAEQWYTALKRLGNAEVEFVLFHGEHHDLSRTGKPSNRLERLERIIGWFDRHNP